MGVTGLWTAIKDAERSFTLESLAWKSITQHGRGLRVAIDVSIWLHQVESTEGGKDPALRTLFYRCCRMYQLGIRPVFVFDGSARPSFKRQRQINTSAFGEHLMLDAMLHLFKFAIWHAKGEAEAECAALQQLGFVDLVFTSDVDFLLFGGKRMVRDWHASDTVRCMDMAWVKDVTDMDRGDMILMALLSGSDYDTGIRGLGATATRRLAKLKLHEPFMNAILRNIGSSDAEIEKDEEEEENIHGLINDMLREIQTEMATNASGVLSRRNNSQIDIDGVYLLNLAREWLDPAVAIVDRDRLEAAAALRKKLDAHPAPNWTGLASFCQNHWQWKMSVVVAKFARLLFPGEMVRLALLRKNNLAKDAARVQMLFGGTVASARQDDLVDQVRKVDEEKGMVQVVWKRQALIPFMEAIRQELQMDEKDSDLCSQPSSQKSASSQPLPSKTTRLAFAAPPAASQLSPSSPLSSSQPSSETFVPDDIHSWIHIYVEVNKILPQWLPIAFFKQAFPGRHVSPSNNNKKKRVKPLPTGQRTLHNFFQ
ncbi:PIN domain-like protein [Gongronella butleri]|nr:PIN domain-like protein [Gongronella butleri]